MVQAKVNLAEDLFKSNLAELLNAKAESIAKKTEEANPRSDLPPLTSTYANMIKKTTPVQIMFVKPPIIPNAAGIDLESFIIIFI